MEIKNVSYKQELQEDSGESRSPVPCFPIPESLMVDGQWMDSGQVLYILQFRKHLIFLSSHFYFKVPL